MALFLLGLAVGFAVTQTVLLGRRLDRLERRVSDLDDPFGPYRR